MHYFHLNPLYSSTLIAKINLHFNVFLFLCRQGLQWKEDELDEFQQRKWNERRQEVEAAGLLPVVMKDYDPLAAVQEPPPTFRAQDERRQANYIEMMFSMGRLHNFQKKVIELKGKRLLLMNERHLMSEVLTALHKDSFVFNNDIEDLEGDLDRTAKLLATYADMEQLWLQASRLLKQAERDRKRAEMRRCGVWEAVKEATDVAIYLRQETRALLKLKIVYESRFQELTQATGDCRISTRANLLAWKEKEDQRVDLAYCKPGSDVQTAYGYGSVICHRRSDDMLLVTLPWGMPPAKVWVYAPHVIRIERSKQLGERCVRPTNSVLAQY